MCCPICPSFTLKICLVLGFITFHTFPKALELTAAIAFSFHLIIWDRGCVWAEKAWYFTKHYIKNGKKWSLMIFLATISDLPAPFFVPQPLYRMASNSLLLCYAEDVRLALISDFQQNGACPHWANDLPRYLGYETSTALDSEGRSDTVALKLTRIDSFCFP